VPRVELCVDTRSELAGAPVADQQRLIETTDPLDQRRSDLDVKTARRAPEPGARVALAGGMEPQAEALAPAWPLLDHLGVAALGDVVEERSRVLVCRYAAGVREVGLHDDDPGNRVRGAWTAEERPARQP